MRSLLVQVVLLGPLVLLQDPEPGLRQEVDPVSGLRIESDITFEPHPRSFFSPDGPAFRLMNAEAKAHRLERLGVDRLYELNFNTALSSLSPEDFARRVIADGLGLAHVVVGEDFCFGKGRKGTAADLARFGGEMGFGVTVTPLLETGGIEVSSTRIRTALTEGRPRDAAAMLGHLHRIEGEVIRGDQRGRELGYPTANMSIDGLFPPKFGVYAVKVDVLTGEHKGHYTGVASAGVRPMFGVNHPNIETHVFDFKGDLYGAELSVALVAYLRPEEKFDSLGALITQMDADSARAMLTFAFAETVIGRLELQPIRRMIEEFRPHIVFNLVEAFAGLGVTVIGISNDSVESHRKFKHKHSLPFTLLSDPDLAVAERYDSKGMLGMKRSVFLLDESGVIRYRHIETLALFRRHREELLEVIEGLS